MQIKWCGTASLFLKEGETVILVDPYLKPFAKGLPPFPVEEGAIARAALITHPHFDHFDVEDLVKRGLKSVYVSKNGIRNVQACGMDVSRFYPIAPNSRIKIGEARVRVLQSRHCKIDVWTALRSAFRVFSWLRVKRMGALLREAASLRVAGDVYAFEVRMHEKKALILGSAGLDAFTDYPTDIDLLVLPMQGRMNMKKCVFPIIARLQPKAVLFDHFDDAFPPFSRSVNVKNFRPILERKFPNIKTVIPVENEWIAV